MSKIETGSLACLDVAEMQMAGWFKSGGTSIPLPPSSNILEGRVSVQLHGQKQVHFTYTRVDRLRNKLQSYDVQIWLASTPCHFGGERFWFKCECGRRVTKLYDFGNRYQCRHCLNLTYASRNKNIRGKKGRMNQYFDLHERIEALEEKAVRETWAGVPTKKRQQLDRLWSRAFELEAVLG
ncbi:MAG TPA: hypothetical protein VHD55_03185 [Candidatus Paceibacterota bacterium]|nr:hypothetical protein [Candidatus Paceibacterota bacterium]